MRAFEYAMALLALVMTAPALAAPNTSAFLKMCEATEPVATCGCMANELVRTRKGQLALDAARWNRLAEADKASGAVALADKYGVTAPEMRAMLPDIKGLLAEAATTCR